MLKANLRFLSSDKVLKITEAAQKLPLETNVRDRIVAKTDEDYLSAVLEEPAVIAVLTWGLSDRYTWISEFQPW